MRKRPAQAIPFDRFHHHGLHHVRHGAPIPPHETFLDRFFTSLARGSGLTRRARRVLVARIEQIEQYASDLKVVRIQHLHNQLNTVVDGGWLGLWTSIRVSVGVA